MYIGTRVGPVSVGTSTRGSTRATGRLVILGLRMMWWCVVAELIILWWGWQACVYCYRLLAAAVLGVLDRAGMLEHLAGGDRSADRAREWMRRAPRAFRWRLPVRPRW